jgi:hypothetical protein
MLRKMFHPDIKTPPHVILYGKAPLSRILLQSLYPHTTPTQTRTTHEGWYRTSYRSPHVSIDYEDINLGNYTTTTIHMFMNWYKSIIGPGGYYRSHTLVLGLSHCEHMKESLQDCLRVYIEKHHHVSFVFMTASYTSLKEPLRSRCVSLRMSCESHLDSYLSPSRALVRDCMAIYTRDYQPLTYEISETLSSYAMNLSKYDICVADLCQDLVQSILVNVRFTHQSKYKTVDYLTRQQHAFKKGYTKLIHIESMLHHVYYLLFAANYEINSKE